VGNIMEWFDFSIYGYFAPVIARLFFPTGDPFLSLMATLGVFASGSLTGALITQNFSESALLSWGWRLAFWCGIPLAATLLIRELNTKAAPSFYLILVGLICLLLTLGIKETRGRSLAD
jgi:MHS family proline/betaine transporter-like MFS transporter